MFTAENFRVIFDAENRKGIDLAGRYFPELEPHTLKVKDKIREIREFRSKQGMLQPEEFTANIAKLKADLADLKFKRSVAIDETLETVSAEVLKPSYKLGLTQKAGPKGKAVFCIDGTPESFFVMKQLQRNINKIYDVKQSNRHDLVSQLGDTVKSKFPFEIVRTDISDFYESIDRKRLLNKLDADQLLSPSSKKYIKQVLDSYGSITSTTIGIPRGVGISAYLAELYLRPIDRQINATPGIVLYCRYVDDIVAVFARPPAGKAQGSYKDLIVNVFAKNGLAHNTAKTKEFDLGLSGGKEFEYLGYRFALRNGKCSVSPSASKISKYEMRINAAFDDYEAGASVDSRRAYRELVSRVKFLTGNTRLLNSKSSAAVGIYFNNPAVSDLSSFQALDKLLKIRIEKIRRPNLRKRLKPYKFVDGFSERRFHNFSIRELQTIVKAWKHG
jgi:hypothetical protein